MATSPRNPYIAGRALMDMRGFCGRDDVFRVVQAELELPERNAIVLYGQRRIGKTSILLNLKSRLPAPPFVVVYFDLMNRARRPMGEVLFELATTIADELALPAPTQTDFDNAGIGFRRQFLPAVYAALGKERRLVLLLDEFDVLDVRSEEQLAANSAAREFFPYLRELMTNEPKLGFVFVVGRKAEELSIEVKASFRAARYYRISVLDEESAHTLIRIAERDGALNFPDDVVRRILMLTACHPYFTQLMCSTLFERAYATTPAPTRAPTIKLADVEAAIPKALEAGENILEWVWDGLPPAERVIFSAVAAGTDENTVVTEDRLVNILQNQGVRILARELELAPDELINWQMLKRADGGYKFFVELIRRWVVEHKPLARVKDELDRINPLADMLYQSGNSFYRMSDFSRAEGQLLQALSLNPNHLKARLLLGEVYRAEGKLDDMVREFAEAFRIDEDGCRVRYEAALLQRAEALERAGKPDEALADYSRALSVSANSRVARDRRNAIWIQRGEVAFGVGDLDKAQEAFKEANAVDWLASVDKARAQRDLEQYATAADQAAAKENWEEALVAYKRLIDLDSGNLHWQEGLERITRERDLSHRYGQGIAAIQQGKWEEAQRALADVINVRPGYKDAIKQLAAATQKSENEREVAGLVIRGEQLLQEGDLAAARNAFAQAGHADKTARIDSQLRAKEITRYTELGEQAVQTERWEDAVMAYQSLVALSNNESIWRDRLEQVIRKRDLYRQYATGVSAMQQQQWAEAQKAFDEVVRLQPDYRDAAERLKVTTANAKREHLEARLTTRDAVRACFMSYTVLVGLIVISFIVAVALSQVGGIQIIGYVFGVIGVVSAPGLGTWWGFRSQIRKRGQWISTFSVGTFAALILGTLSGYASNSLGSILTGMTTGLVGGFTIGLACHLALKTQYDWRGFLVWANVLGWISCGLIGGFFGSSPQSVSTSVALTLLGGVIFTPIALARFFMKAPQVKQNP